MKNFRIIIIFVFLFIFAALVFFPGIQEELVITHGPYLQCPTDSSITVVWFTNKNCVSKVEYLPENGLSSETNTLLSVQNSSHGLVFANTKHHAVRIGGLTPGKKYKYRVFSKEILKFEPYKVAYGDSLYIPAKQNEFYHFQTLNSSKENILFGVVNDIHENSEKLNFMLDHILLENPELIFFNGDMFDHFEEEYQVFDKLIDICSDRFSTDVPFCFVRGNHEARGVFARNFFDYFPTETGSFYRSFNHGPACFIMLDSGEDKPDTHWAYAGLTDFDSYRAEQAKWLKKTIHSKDFNEAKIRIVLMHIPPFGGSNRYGEQQIRELFVPLLNEGDIDLLICAHTHDNAFHPAFEFDNNFPIIINGNNTALITRVREKQLDIKVIRYDGRLMDTISVTAKRYIK